MKRDTIKILSSRYYLFNQSSYNMHEHVIVEFIEIHASNLFLLNYSTMFSIGKSLDTIFRNNTKKIVVVIFFTKN